MRHMFQEVNPLSQKVSPKINKTVWWLQNEDVIALKRSRGTALSPFRRELYLS